MTDFCKTCGAQPVFCKSECGPCYRKSYSQVRLAKKWKGQPKTLPHQKWCIRCHQVFDRAYFSRWASKPDGLQHICIYCQGTSLDIVEGARFGEWVVIGFDHGRTKVRCSCGTEKAVRPCTLSSGHSKSCGHREDLVGHKFGHLVVTGPAPDKGVRTMWGCVCDCGSKVIIGSQGLRSGTSTSCRCRTRKTITEKYGAKIEIGFTYGRLTVTQVLEAPLLKNYRYVCRCSCGTLLQRSHDSLRKGQAKSCGCLVSDQSSLNGQNRETIETRKRNYQKKRRERPDLIREAVLAAARSSNLVRHLPHWRTEEPVFCTGSYEWVVVNYLNYCRVDYQHQVQVATPYGEYFVDFYFPDRDTYVEVKGSWRHQNRTDRTILSRGWLKYHWFKANVGKVELWTAEDVRLLRSGLPKLLVGNPVTHRVLMHPVTWKGQTKTYAEWAKELGLPESTIYHRLKRGLTSDEVLTVKSRSRIVEHQGEQKTLAEWSRVLNLSYGRCANALDRGLTLGQVAQQVAEENRKVAETTEGLPLEDLPFTLNTRHSPQVIARVKVLLQLLVKPKGETPLGRTLYRLTRNGKGYDSGFDSFFRKERPSWFPGPVPPLNKSYLLSLEDRPVRGTTWDRILASYCSPCEPSFDPAFREKIRSIKPHWFKRS